jgi:hypothetical protein
MNCNCNCGHIPREMCVDNNTEIASESCQGFVVQRTEEETPDAEPELEEQDLLPVV